MTMILKFLLFGMKGDKIALLNQIWKKFTSLQVFFQKSHFKSTMDFATRSEQCKALSTPWGVLTIITSQIV